MKEEGREKKKGGKKEVGIICPVPLEIYSIEVITDLSYVQNYLMLSVST